MFRKITTPAESRMRARTAREQFEEVQRQLNRPQEESIPDADDESARQGYWPQSEQPCYR